MPTTDEELAELQKAVEAKRQTLAETQAQREANERSLTNDITAAQLLAEGAKLDVAIAEQQGMMDRAGDNTNPTLAAAKATMEQAVLQMEAQAENTRVQLEAQAAAEAQAEADAQEAAAVAAATAEAEAAALAAANADIEGSGQ